MKKTLGRHDGTDRLPAISFRQFGDCMNRFLAPFPGTVAYGSAEETDAYCKKTLEICMAHRGYHFAPSHAIQDNTPEENVIAMYQAAHTYGVYR